MALDAIFVSVRSLVMPRGTYIPVARKLLEWEVKRLPVRGRAPHWAEVSSGAPRVTITQWSAVVNTLRSGEVECISVKNTGREATAGRRAGMRAIVDCLLAFAVLLAIVLMTYAPAFGSFTERFDQVSRPLEAPLF